jgi:hypothetical protein
MKLRKKPKIEIESYYKMFDLRNESVRVLKILHMVWKRDALKKNLLISEHKEFELGYENMLKDKGMMNGFKTQGQKGDLEKLLKSKSPEDVMPYHIDERREPILNKQQ